MDYHGRSSWLGFLRLEVPKTVETRRYGIQERLRMTLQYDLPRIGRYRLYDRAGRKVWDPIYMCGPMPEYPSCEVHECDAFSCLCPFEPRGP